MSELKSMIWDDTVWDALRASVTPMPPFVRKKALFKIIHASEENAKSRSSEQVEAADLLKAVNEKVPSHIRKICLEALEEHGITEDQWESSEGAAS